MFPTLFSIGSITISSFGVFLAAGFLFGVFLVWRLARAWDLDEEKVLDLTLLTFLGALSSARLYFILENFHFFGLDPLKWLLINRFPGFSFWGGFLGGFLTLYYFAKRKKLDFLLLADIASVGFLGGLILADLGCFFSGCAVGIPSKLFLALPMVGSIGKRIPVQAIEAILFFIVFIGIWSKATHFHTKGTIVATTLISFGLIKILTEPLRDQHDASYFFSAVLLILGITLFYKVTKRKPFEDLRMLVHFLIMFVKKENVRRTTFEAWGKTWYNFKVAFGWKLRNLGKLIRRLNVKFSHKNSKYY